MKKLSFLSLFYITIITFTFSFAYNNSDIMSIYTQALEKSNQILNNKRDKDRYKKSLKITKKLCDEGFNKYKNVKSDKFKILHEKICLKTIISLLGTEDYLSTIEYADKICNELKSETACSLFVLTEHTYRKEIGEDTLINYYKKACDEKNYVKDCSSLANYYENKCKKTKKFCKEKDKYRKKACDLGDKDSCAYLKEEKAELYKKQKNYKKALEIYKELCEKYKKGFDCYTVASYFNFGKPGIEVDYEKAMKYYELACKHFELISLPYCANLNQKRKELIEKAETESYFSYKKNEIDKAIKYSMQACNLGDNDACIDAQRLKQEQKREEQALKQKVLNYLNGNLNWNGGDYIICSDGTTEFKAIKSQIGGLMNDLTDTIFKIKTNIDLESFCNNLRYIYQTGTEKQLKKLFYLLAEALVNAENNSLDGFPKVKRVLEIRYTIDIANTSHMYDQTFGGFRGHLALTRIIGEIVRQNVMFDKKIPDRDVKVIRLLLRSRFSKALKEADNLVSDEELRKLEKEIREIYKI